MSRSPQPNRAPARPGRYTPSEELLHALEDAAENGTDVRAVALREVQRSRVDPSEKFKLYIPAANVTRENPLDVILQSLHEETQTSLWKTSLSAICDFVALRGRGLRFTCTSRELAIKLGGSSVRILGREYIIKKFSVFDRMYFVDLKNVPSDLDDGAIFDYFNAIGLQPIITPTHQVGQLMSRDRTAWFNTPDVPAELFIGEDVPLREIFFDGFDSPVFVNHKNRSLNITPPSIVAREERAKAANTISAIDLDNVQGPSQEPEAMSTDGTDNADLEEAIDLTKPALESATYQDWISSTTPIYRTPKIKTPTFITTPVTNSPADDGRMVFGIPVQPTQFELAFSDNEDGDFPFSDIDVNAIANEIEIAATPLRPTESVGKLIDNYSLIRTPRMKMQKASFQRITEATRADFKTIQDPECRLAALTAQPLSLAPTLHHPDEPLQAMTADHAILRKYSGSTQHGDQHQFLPRLKFDFPDEVPDSKTVLQTLFPDPTHRDLAQAYALFDLFLRSHAAPIYYDPVKVAALCQDTTLTCLKFSQFLLWSDEVLASILNGPLGESITDSLPQHLSASFSLILNSTRDFSGDDAMGTNQSTSSTSNHGASL